MIAANEGNVYVVWDVYDETNNNYPVANNNGGIYFSKSTDNGNRFGQIIRLNHDTKYGEPQISAEGNNVYVVWSSSGPHVSSNIKDNNNNGSRIFFAKSTDTGSTFIRPISINQQFKNPSNVQIVGDKNEVYIAAQGIINNNALKNTEIFLLKGSAAGDIFEKAANISNNSGVSECPSLTVSGNKLFMTWEDNTPGNHEILFSSKTFQIEDFQ
jgi:hypothetical protein